MKRIVWFRRAVYSLEQIADYIARDHPQAAGQVVRNIRNAADSLAQYPELGTLGRVDGTRELVVPGLPYVLPGSTENGLSFYMCSTRLESGHRPLIFHNAGEPI